MASGRQWFKMDVDYFMNPKVAGLSSNAVTLHMALMMYCAQQLTDGLVCAPHGLRVARAWLPYGARAYDTAYTELEERNLIRTTPEGVIVHGWLDMNPQLERAAVEKQRAAARARQHRHRTPDVTP